MGNYANRCPKCGAIANTHLVDSMGRVLYLCTRPVHKLRVNVQQKTVSFAPVMHFCNTAIDKFGKVFHGWVKYWDSEAKGGKGVWVAEKF